MKYTIQLIWTNPENTMQIKHIESVQGDSLVEIAAKIPIMIAKQMRQEHEEEIRELKNKLTDDDIPF